MKIVFLFWLLFISFQVLSSDVGSQGSLEERVRAADLIFQGVVSDIQYAFSEDLIEGEMYKTPYTFVSYRVEEVFKGNIQTPSVTLQFYGGPLDEDKAVLMSHSPLFDRGEQDLLLVSGNTETLCPLVACSGGRYRIVNGQILSDAGQLIHINTEGEFVAGEFVDVQEVREHQMLPGMTLSRQRRQEGESETLESHQLAGRNTLLPGQAAFSQHVRDAVEQYHTQEELQSLPQFKNANVDDPISDVFRKYLDAPIPEGEKNNTEIEVTDPSVIREMALEQEYYRAIDDGKSDEELETILKKMRAELEPAQAPVLRSGDVVKPVSEKNNRERVLASQASVPLSAYLKIIIFLIVLCLLLFFALKRNG